jgi:hypothetical protein
MAWYNNTDSTNVLENAGMLYIPGGPLWSQTLSLSGIIQVLPSKTYQIRINKAGAAGTNIGFVQVQLGFMYIRPLET